MGRAEARLPRLIAATPGDVSAIARRCTLDSRLPLVRRHDYGLRESGVEKVSRSCDRMGRTSLTVRPGGGSDFPPLINPKCRFFSVEPTQRHAGRLRQL